MSAPTAFPEALRGKWELWDEVPVIWIASKSTGTRAEWKRGVQSSVRGSSRYGEPLPPRIFVEVGLPPAKHEKHCVPEEGLPHQRRPDVDNVLKCVVDAYTEPTAGDDSHVCAAGCSKVFSFAPYIRIYHDMSGNVEREVAGHWRRRAERVVENERERTRKRSKTERWRSYHKEYQRAARRRASPEWKYARAVRSLRCEWRARVFWLARDWAHPQLPCINQQRDQSVKFYRR